MISENNSVSPATIFWTFFRIGLFTFGGGLAMSSVIRHELVIKRHWLKEADFLTVISLATVVPGVIAVNIAYLLGRRLFGKAGSTLAVLGVIIPSFLVILLVVGILLPFFDHPKVAAFLRGCSIAVAGQLAFAGLIFSKKLLLRWQNLGACLAGIVAVGVFGLHPLWGIIIAVIFVYWLWS